MRIALYTSTGVVNGVAVHCLFLTRYLLARGHRVLLLHRDHAWIATQPGLEGAELVPTSYKRRPGELLRVGRIVDAFAPDVIHTHQSSAHSYRAAWRLFGTVPVVATAHVAHIQLHWRMNHFVISTSEPVSDFNRRFNLVPRRMLRVIPNFVDCSSLNLPTPEERRAVRVELGIPEGSFVVGSIAHFSAYKRPADMIRAFGHVAAKDPHARLLIIGGQFDGAETARAAVSELGIADRCVFPGYRTDATRLLAAMNVFALASSRESGPLALLEAMMRGLPVVATRVGMVPDFVVEGTTGYLVDVGDTAAMGRHLTALAADPGRRAAYGAAGRAHVMTNYSVEAICPRIEAVLAEVAAIRHRGIFSFFARSVIRTPSNTEAAGQA